MESIGAILKAARERRQISVADVVAATKMTSFYVAAIESNNFKALVAPVYARGFIKLYAECVGLDPTPLLKQFDADSRTVALPFPPSPKVAPRKTSVAYTERGLKAEPAKAVPGATLASAAPLQVGAYATIPARPPFRLASLLMERWAVVSRMFSTRVQWPPLKVPGMFSRHFPLPAIVWQRIAIGAGVVLLIFAVCIVWDYSNRGMPIPSAACRWLADPPAPYLAVEAHTPPPSR